ncbi:MAG: SOS response-associated peptidase [Alphaproteobacteria bacterium]|jgi:putative SOS response-associated peptidase YedK|nr:SOS response-associated peptidase [Alphaproteobacteria bacterium]HJP20229.1 SOS response-associated peptidase [Alphaproteobacteria bacterium]
MCGRFAFTSPVEAMRQLFGIEERPNLAPRYNIAPTQEVVIVRHEEVTGRCLARAHWGLLPPWAKDRAMAARLINARAESVAEKPSFRAAFRARRCLIPADGYYEWVAMKDGKQPYRLARRDGGLFAFAGLWDRWTPPEGDEPVESCTIITTAADDVVRPIHQRMPAILAPGDYAAWLGESEVSRDQLLTLVQGASSPDLIATPVSRRLNSPRHDDAACIEPVEL